MIKEAFNQFVLIKQASVQLSWRNLVSQEKIRIHGGTCCPLNLILTCLIRGLFLKPVSF